MSTAFIVVEEGAWGTTYPDKNRFVATTKYGALRKIAELEPMKPWYDGFRIDEVEIIE